jgi:NADH dehydrogenase
MAHRVLILGGGFAGLTAARKLERIAPPASTQITLVNDVNFMLYTPLLPGAAGGSLEPRHVVVPLREELRGDTRLVLGHVTGADPGRRRVFVHTTDGRDRELAYDQLVVCLGSTSRTFPIPGLREHAWGFKTLSEAMALRDQLVQCLEKAETTDDAEARHSLLTFVMVGGGYTGVEGIAELQDLAADLFHLYPRSRLHGMRFIVVEALDRLMNQVPKELERFADAELRRRGIEIRTSTTVERVSADSVELSSGEVVPTRTVIWVTGLAPHPVVAKLGLPLDRGRIKADRFCQVDGFTDVWALGDAAAVPDPSDLSRPSPQTAQHALRQGRVVAHNVADALAGGGNKRPFKYKTLGVFVDMGRRQAVAQTVGINWSGLPAWFLARSYHIAQMPGFKRQARLMTDWTVALFFGRDSSELGQLGHPPELEGGLEAHSIGGTKAEPAPEAQRA